MSQDFLDPAKWSTFGQPPLVPEISMHALSGLTRNYLVEISPFRDRVETGHQCVRTTSSTVRIRLALYRSTGRNANQVPLGLHLRRPHARVELRYSRRSASRLGL